MKLICSLFFIAAIFSGCVTNFVNKINVQLDAQHDPKERIIASVDKIAEKHALHKDGNGTTENKICYFGRPYHYYVIELTEKSNNTFQITITHEARMSGNPNKNNTVELDLLEEIKSDFKKSIVNIEVDIR